MTEEDFPALPGLCLLRRGIGSVFLQENLRVRQAEAVDGLLHVSHQEAILFFFRQRRENRVLHPVGILVFIHHDFPEPGADFPGCPGPAGSIFSQKQVQGTVLQISEIQNPAASFGPGIVLIKPAHQLDEPPGSRFRLAQVREHLGGIIGKAFYPLFQLVLHRLPDGLHLVGKHRIVSLAGKAQRSEIDVLSAVHLIPGGAGPEVFQLFNQPGDILNGLFHAVVRFQPGKALPQDFQFPVQPGKEILHQKSSPDGLPCVADPFQSDVFQASIQPGLGI